MATQVQNPGQLQVRRCRTANETGTLEAPHFLTYRRLRVGGSCCSEAGYFMILLSPSLHRVLNLNWQSHSRLRRPPRNTRTISVAGFETSGALTVPFTSKASDFRVAQTYPKDSVLILKLTKEVLCLTFFFYLIKLEKRRGNVIKQWMNLCNGHCNGAWAKKFDWSHFRRTSVAPTQTTAGIGAPLSLVARTP